MVGVSLAQKAVKTGRLASIYAISSIAAQIIAFFSLPFFTRYLPPEQMGIVQVSVQFGALLSILLQLGLISGLKKEYFHMEAPDRPRLVRSEQIGQWIQGTTFAAFLSVAALPWINTLLPATLPLPLLASFSTTLNT